MPHPDDIVLIKFNHCCSGYVGYARVVEVNEDNGDFYVRGLDWDWEHLFDVDDDYVVIPQGSPFNNIIGGL